MSFCHERKQLIWPIHLIWQKYIHVFIYFCCTAKEKHDPQTTACITLSSTFALLALFLQLNNCFFSSLAEQGVYWGQAFAGVFPTWWPLRVERCGSTYCTAIFSCSVCIQRWRFRLYTTCSIHCPRFEVPAFEKAIGEILVNPWGTIFGYSCEQLCDRNTSTRHHCSLYTDHHNKSLDSVSESKWT